MPNHDHLQGWAVTLPPDDPLLQDIRRAGKPLNVRAELEIVESHQEQLEDGPMVTVIDKANLIGASIVHESRI